MNPKNFLIIIGLALLLLVPVKTALAEGDSEETRQIVLALFEAFNRHDLEAIVALYSPEAKMVTPSFPEPRYGRDVVRLIYKDHFDNIPGVHDEVTRLVAAGNEAAVEFTATWDQPTEADPKARGALKISVFLKVEEGLVVEDITYYDRMVFEPMPDDDQAE